MTRFAYDGQDVWADLDSGNNLLVRYVHGDVVDQLFARIVPGSQTTVTWYLTDRLGSVRDLINQAGTVIDHLSYDGFGNPSETQSGNGDRYKFTGREYDSESGQIYYRARYLGVATGRFTSQDPLGFDAGDANLYRYVLNQPLTLVDPTGLEAGTFQNGTTEFPKGTPYLNELAFINGAASWTFPEKGDIVIPGKVLEAIIKQNPGAKPEFVQLSGLRVRMWATIEDKKDVECYYWHQTVDWSYTSKKPIAEATLKDTGLSAAYFNKGPRVDGNTEVFRNSKPEGNKVFLTDAPGQAVASRVTVRGDFDLGPENVTLKRPDLSELAKKILNIYGDHGVVVTAKFVSELKFKKGAQPVVSKGKWDWGFQIDYPVQPGGGYGPRVLPLQARWTRGN
jgi:RHS repeat-associated protein